MVEKEEFYNALGGISLVVFGQLMFMWLVVW